jgi:F-type H+-transporting ATPase subunit delta
MPLLNSLATPYAEALLQVAESRQETDTVAEQARELLALWHSSAQLREAMASLQNLLKLLADRQRIAVLDAVLERFLELYRELRQITLAKVSSATPLSEEQQAQLNQKVQAIAGTQAVEFVLTVDPALIGGFVVNLGSQVIDASLAGQVRRLGLALAKV